MTGERAFSKVQYGKESTRGTAVAATRMLLGKMPAVKTDRKPIFPERAAGVRAKAVDGVIHQYLYRNTLSIPNGYFQALLPIFGCGLKGNVTAAEQTASQSDYLWNFTPSMTGSNALDSLTIELGDDTQAFETEYAMFESIKIAWDVAQGMDASPVSIDADFFGRQLTPTSFTGAISLPTVTDMNGKLSHLYVDSTWAGVGSTELTNALRNASIEILTGAHPKFTGGTTKYFSTHGEGYIEAMVNVTIEGDSQADALFDAQQAGDFNVIRLQLDGPQIGSGVNHKLRLDIGGMWEDVSPLGGEDKGSNLHTCTFHGFYNATGAKMLQTSVYTDRSTY